MFQRNIEKIFKDVSDVSDIADDILVVGYDRDGKDQDQTLKGVLQICRQLNLNLNKDKCHFRCMQVPFFGKIISRNGEKPDPRKLQTIMEKPSKTKKNSTHSCE